MAGSRIQLLITEPQIQVVQRALRDYSAAGGEEDDVLIADELRLEILKKRREQMF